jgi:hypothetical protein
MQQTVCIQCFDDLKSEVSKTDINKNDMNHATLETPMFMEESIWI